MTGSRIRAAGGGRYILKLLTEKGVTVRDAVFGERSVSFSVYGRDVDAAIAILAASGHDYCFVKDGRVGSFLKKNILRFGLYVGLIFGILATVFYSQNITRVEVKGNESVSTERILGAIGEDLSLPARKSSVSCDELIKKIISVDGISSAAAEVKGNTLKISVLEEPPRPSVLDKTEYKDIVSGYDGIITRIITYSGTPLVKSGDTVEKGQTLISCDVKIADEIYIKENALGEIYARVWETKEVVFTPTVVAVKRTGRTEKVVRFFSPPRDYSGKFSSYETETDRHFTDAAVPLPYYVTTYFETEETEAEFDFFADEEGIVKAEAEKLEEDLPEGGIPIRYWYELKRLDKNILLVIYYEIEIKIN